MPSDTRPSKFSIIDLTVHIPFTSSQRESTVIEPNRPPPRWRTLEFLIYTAIALVIIPVMTWIPISASMPSRSNFSLYQHRLSEGWLFGRQVDNSDHQYRSFRGNIGPLVLLAASYLLLKAAYVFVKHQATRSDSLHLLSFNLTFSILMLLILHGSSALKILLILSVNYALVKSCGGRRAGPFLTWILNCGVLLANDRYSGYVFGDILSGLAVLDQYSGVYPRWHVSFNMTMLRLISFGMDYHWACHHTGPFEAGRELNDKERSKSAHPKNMYSLVNFLAYAVYPPLYIAGPIITFNDFLWQHRRPTLIPLRTTLMYLLRLAFTVLTMEFVLHFMYVVAIKDTKAWRPTTPGGGNVYTPAEISMIGFWNLMIVWLKLLIPWRFFRAWALLDGIDAPENMIRCMANNYSTLGFWRSWHRSYNLWIIRYIYVPLGGSNRVTLNSIIVFSFVALWHDLTFRLLAWGWLVSVFFIPELVASWLLPARTYSKFWWYRHVCALGGVFNMVIMVFANLVGFVIGTDGARFFFTELFGTVDGLRFIFIAAPCMFIGVQLMFEYREEEMRRGIYRRC